MTHTTLLFVLKVLSQESKSLCLAERLIVAMGAVENLAIAATDK